jgi:hypothetical protein
MTSPSCCWSVCVDEAEELASGVKFSHMVYHRSKGAWRCVGLEEHCVHKWLRWRKGRGWVGVGGVVVCQREGGDQEQGQAH